RGQVLLARIPGREVRGAVAVDGAVITGQVARALRRSDDVIGWNARPGIRQRDLLDGGTGLFIDPDGLSDGRLDFGVQTLTEELRDHADAKRCGGRVKSRRVIGNGIVHTGRVARVVPRD